MRMSKGDQMRHDMVRRAMRREATQQEYYSWVKTEPLSDPCVDAENVGENDGSPDYWTRMLAAGKDAVELRKSDAVLRKLDAELREEALIAHERMLEKR